MNHRCKFTAHGKITEYHYQALEQKKRQHMSSRLGARYTEGFYSNDLTERALQRETAAAVKRRLTLLSITHAASAQRSRRFVYSAQAAVAAVSARCLNIATARTRAACLCTSFAAAACHPLNAAAAWRRIHP